jgi:serine/threonine protein kinase
MSSGSSGDRGRTQQRDDSGGAYAGAELVGVVGTTAHLPVVEAAVQRFEAAWHSGRQEPIESCLPDPDHPRYLATLEELIQIELEFLWKACGQQPTLTEAPMNRPPLVEDYLNRFPSLRSSDTVIRLLRQECRVRSRFSERPTSEEYRQRFPELLGSGIDITVAADEDDWSLRRPEGLDGYEILGILGRGGMGIVYKARQIKTDRIVALKMLLAGELSSRNQRERFRAEAEIVARLQHPGIVQVFDVGEHEGRPYLVLEYCPGGTLAQRLMGRPWLARAAAELVEQLARAVAVAHASGIVHRDLKPANVLFRSDETPISEATTIVGSLHDRLLDRAKIADFGLSKRLDADFGRTSTGAILGTPAYMSPEQASGESNRVGPAADIYALGAILYEVLAGRLPFTGANYIEILDKVRQQDAEPLRTIQPATPRDLDTICRKCLRKEPSQRYATAADLADDLRRFLGHEPIHARPVGNWERARLWVRRRPLVAGMLAAILLLSVAGASVSTYFAIAAAKETRNAEREAGNAMRSADQARLREIDAQVKEREATAAKLELEQTLARSLLKPFAPNGEGAPLNPIEIDTLWELATLRSEAVRRLFLLLALEKAETAWQLTARRNSAVVAALGLDERRRMEFQQVIRQRTTATSDARIKQACIILGLALGGDVIAYLREAEQMIAAPLPLIEGMTFVPALWRELGRLPTTLPPDDAERAARIVLKIGVNGGYINPETMLAPASPYPRLIAGLDGNAIGRLIELLRNHEGQSIVLLYIPLIQRLDAGAVPAVADAIMGQLRRWNLPQRLYVARVLNVLAPRLPSRDAKLKAQTVCREILRGNELQAGRIAPHELASVVDAVLLLMPLLDGDTRADAAKQLVRRVTDTWDEVRGDADYASRIAREFGRIAPFLDAESLPPLVALVSERMAKDPTDHWHATHAVYRQLVVHLDGPRLAMEEKAVLSALATNDRQAFARLPDRLRTAFAVAQRLKSPMAEELHAAAMRLLTESIDAKRGFNNALAELFRDRAGEFDDFDVKASTGAALHAMANPHCNYFGNAALVTGYLAILDRVPIADVPVHAQELVNTLADESAASPYAARECARALAALAQRLPAAERDRMLAAAAANLGDRLPRVQSPDVMASFQEAAATLGHPLPPSLGEFTEPVVKRLAANPGSDATVVWYETTRGALCDLAVTFAKKKAAEIASQMTTVMHVQGSRLQAQAYGRLLAILDREDSSRCAEACLRYLLELIGRASLQSPLISTEYVAELPTSMARFLSDQQLADFLKMPDPAERVHPAMLDEFARRRKDLPLVGDQPAALLVGSGGERALEQSARRFQTVWDFERWAKVHRAEVDLVSPPRR